MKVSGEEDSKKMEKMDFDMPTLSDPFFIPSTTSRVVLSNASLGDQSNRTNQLMYEAGVALGYPR